LLAAEAWGALGEGSEGTALPANLSARLEDLGVEAGVVEALSDTIRTGVRFGAVLGFALARTYPGSSEELDVWLERAIEYAGESVGATEAPEHAPDDDPSAA
jgi:hypothetical protein